MNKDIKDVFTKTQIEKMKDPNTFKDPKNLFTELNKKFTYAKPNNSCLNASLNIELNFKSIEMKFWQVDEGEIKKKIVNQIDLPFIFSCFLYLKGEDAFKFLVSKIINFDKSFKKIKINYNEIPNILNKAKIFEYSKQKANNTTNSLKHRYHTSFMQTNERFFDAKNDTNIITNFLYEGNEEKDIFNYNKFSFFWITPKNIFEMEKGELRVNPPLLHSLLDLFLPL